MDDEDKTEFQFCLDENCDGSTVMTMLIHLCEDYARVHEQLEKAINLLEDIADEAENGSH